MSDRSRPAPRRKRYVQHHTSRPGQPALFAEQNDCMRSAAHHTPYGALLQPGRHHHHPASARCALRMPRCATAGPRPAASLTPRPRREDKLTLAETYVRLYRRIPVPSSLENMSAEFIDRELRVLMKQNNMLINDFDEQRSKCVPPPPSAAAGVRRGVLLTYCVLLELAAARPCRRPRRPRSRLPRRLTPRRPCRYTERTKTQKIMGLLEVRRAALRCVFYGRLPTAAAPAAAADSTPPCSRAARLPALAALAGGGAGARARRLLRVPQPAAAPRRQRRGRTPSSF